MNQHSPAKNGAAIEITAEGDVILQPISNNLPTLTLKHTKYSPNLTINVISVPALQ
jgi:hypothetical protein